jgi:hypothetical protein
VQGTENRLNRALTAEPIKDQGRSSSFISSLAGLL